MSEKQYKIVMGLFLMGSRATQLARQLKLPLRDVQAVLGTATYDQYLRNRYKRKDDRGGLDDLLRSFGT